MYTNSRARAKIDRGRFLPHKKKIEQTKFQKGVTGTKDGGVFVTDSLGIFFRKMV